MNAHHLGSTGQPSAVLPLRNATGLLLALCSLAAASCGYSSSGYGAPGSAAAPPAIESFTAATDAVFVGEATELTAVFSGDSASIDGIGPVESGRPVATSALARGTTFTLTVRGGQQQAEARIFISAVYRDRLRELAPSPVARRQHVAMALADGGALVMGGNSSDAINVPDNAGSQRFDPRTETFFPGPDLAFSAEAVLTVTAGLAGGGFLLAGGGTNSPSRATQVFDAAASRFDRVGDLGSRHNAGATATALRDGAVLVAGGGLPAIPAAERYDPATGLWSSAGDMGLSRRGHSATLLAEGRVLIVGGLTCCDAVETFTSTAEIYDPLTGIFQPTGPLTTARAFHAATLLSDGRVLVTGGFIDKTPTETTSTEIYDPSTGLFTPSGELQAARHLHSAIRLTDGRVLVVGGERAVPATDLFDPATNLWSPGPLLQPAFGASTATLLGNGKVLVFGGEGVDGFPVATALLYE